MEGLTIIQSGARTKFGLKHEKTGKALIMAEKDPRVPTDRTLATPTWGAESRVGTVLTNKGAGLKPGRGERGSPSRTRVPKNSGIKAHIVPRSFKKIKINTRNP